MSTNLCSCLLFPQNCTFCNLALFIFYIYQLEGTNHSVISTCLYFSSFYTFNFSKLFVYKPEAYLPFFTSHQHYSCLYLVSTLPISLNILCKPEAFLPFFISWYLQCLSHLSTLQTHLVTDSVVLDPELISLSSTRCQQVLDSVELGGEEPVLLLELTHCGGGGHGGWGVVLVLLQVLGNDLPDTGGELGGLVVLTKDCDIVSQRVF